MSQRHTLLHPNETATVHSTNSTANDWTILKPKCALQCHLFLNIWNTTTKLSDIFVSSLSHEVNNKERQCCLESVAFHTWACARSHVLFDRSVCLAGASVLLRGSSWDLVFKASPLTPTSLPLFHCSHSVTGACPPFCVGAHGWLARICQPWEQFPSRSWLPIVEAPGYHSHPASILRCSC